MFGLCYQHGRRGGGGPQVSSELLGRKILKAGAEADGVRTDLSRALSLQGEPYEQYMLFFVIYRVVAVGTFPM